MASSVGSKHSAQSNESCESSVGPTGHDKRSESRYAKMVEICEQVPTPIWCEDTAANQERHLPLDC